MTNEELKQYYADLLVLQYRDKPKAAATIKALADQAIMNQISTTIMNAFNIDDADGKQLDIIGKYVGARRNTYTFTSAITLNDDDYRTLIRVAIIKNTFGSSLYEIQQLINQFFEGTMILFDFQNMRMGYFFDSAIGGQDLVEVFVSENFLPKPMGVELAALIYSNNISSFFGYQTYEIGPYNVNGFNTYDDYSMESPWLSYEDAIFPQ